MNLKATEIAERLMERIADYSDEALSELMQAMDEIETKHGVLFYVSDDERAAIQAELARASRAR